MTTPEEQVAARRARVLRMQRMVARGMTQAEIGEIEGISDRRVGALLREPIGPSPATLAAREARMARDARIVKAHHRGWTQAELAAEHGLSVTTIERICAAARRADQTLGRPR